MSDDSTKHIGKVIQELRKAKNITQEELSRLSGVTYATITKLEAGKVKNPSLQVISKISRILEVSLDQFSMVQEFTGDTAMQEIHTDILKTLEVGDEMLISGIDESNFLTTDAEEIKDFIKQISKKELKQKLISCEGDVLGYNNKLIEYRWISKEYFTPIPIYCYGSKMASIIWGETVQSVIIDNHNIAEAYRRQFYFIWNQAKPAKIKSTI